MKCISIFKCNPQIEVIDKSHCSLEDVPNFQNYSRSLEELFLDANKLQVLNENVFRLTKLRRFSFSDNAIEDIPSDIGKLINLVELDCSRNKIQIIPEQIKFLRGLQVCDFSANNIEYLPSGLVQLKNLTCLTLNYCPIKNLPDDFGLLKNLESLELRENELENLPPSITGLESLKKLDIGRNLISRLPDDLGRLANLEYLLVDGNRLESIPADIGRLKNLQCLDLGQQEYGLKSLPDEISGLISLTDLHLSENHLQSLPNGIKYLRNLTIFKADNNYLSELNPRIEGCKSLQELVLTSNQITKLPSTIGALTDLRSLNVDTNLLKELPQQIGLLKNLGILSLRDNLLTTLPDEFGQLEMAKVVDLSGNRLEYLPTSITALNLKALWLSKNQAQPLPKLQIDELPTGIKVLTCYLLPQQSEGSESEDYDHSNGIQNELIENQDRHVAVSFDTAAVDDAELSNDAQFVRQNTPHPRELKARHQKLFNTSKEVELGHKGHDNASFSINDNFQPYEGEFITTESNGLMPAYQHLEYESNGLPEIPITVSQPSAKPSTIRNFISRQDRSSDRDEGGLENRATNDNGYEEHSRSRIDSKELEPGQKGAMPDSKKPHSCYSNPKYQVLDMLVRRSKNHKPGLGLSIAGGKDTPPYKNNDEGIFVSKVTAGGPAEAAGIKIGDKILAVNSNIFNDGITHQKAVDIFKKVKPDCFEFTMRVQRDPDDEFYETDKVDDDCSVQASETNGSAISNMREFMLKNPDTTKSNSSTLPPGMSLLDNSLSKNIIYTTLVKDYKHDLGLILENRPFGNETKSGWSNIVISNIKQNSIASRDGKLQIDDRLLSINGADVTGIDLDRIMLMLEGTERFIRIVVSRGESDDPIDAALRNMPIRPPLGSWFSSTSNMSHRPSLIESYQRPTFGSVNSLQKQSQLLGAKPPKPPKPSHLFPRELDTSELAQYEGDPVARPRGTSNAEQPPHDAEKRAVWRRERLKSIEDDVEMAKLIAEAQRRRREEK